VIDSRNSDASRTYLREQIQAKNVSSSALGFLPTIACRAALEANETMAARLSDESRRLRLNFIFFRLASHGFVRAVSVIKISQQLISTLGERRGMVRQ
jgi:hypothetical protein